MTTRFARFASPPAQQQREPGGFLCQSHVGTEFLARTPAAELQHMMACIHPSRKDEFKVVFFMLEECLIAYNSLALIRLYKRLRHSTLAEPLALALVPRASDAVACSWLLTQGAGSELPNSDVS